MTLWLWKKKYRQQINFYIIKVLSSASPNLPEMAKYNNVLLIDDDPLTVFITERLITKYDFCEKVTSFTSSSDALKYFESNIGLNNIDSIPEIILLDINMPLLDGWGFMDRLAQLTQNNKVVTQINIFSATVEKHDVERAMRYPFVKNFLIKPLLKEHFGIL